MRQLKDLRPSSSPFALGLFVSSFIISKNKDRFIPFVTYDLRSNVLSLQLVCAQSTSRQRPKRNRSLLGCFPRNTPNSLLLPLDMALALLMGTCKFHQQQDPRAKENIEEDSLMCQKNPAFTFSEV